MQKKWLHSFYILIAFLCYGVIIQLFTNENKLVVMDSIISISVWSAITYYCAYKKKGTKWLMFNLILVPFQVLTISAELYKANSGTFLLKAIFIVLAIYGYFWYCSLRLRQFYKREKQLSNAVCQNTCVVCEKLDGAQPIGDTD